jgi:cation diffusion facilitator CzcD-associated flavoprotein CzcO
MDALVSQMNPTDSTETWLQSFEAAVTAGNADAAAALFLTDGHWRDVLAFTWKIETFNGAGEIESLLDRTLAKVQARNFHIPAHRTPPRIVSRAGRDCIEAIISFDTVVGKANGILRLVPDPDQPSRSKAWIIATALDEIRGHEELIGDRRPGGQEYARQYGADNWLDLRNRAKKYEDHEPAVLVVGAGQAGLTVAARLTVLGVDTLMVDRFARVGDNWRNRYHSLTLHNEVWVNDMPYMPFPPNWPVYIPKDKLANWFESYAEAMELNVWTSTEMVTGSYDEAEGVWTVTLRNVQDGSERVVKPRHVIYATGVSAIPIMPNLPGMDAFKGKVMHSGAYRTGKEWEGKKAIVVGTGTSGHDVAQELTTCGADVTLMQRSPTHVVSLQQAQRVYAAYYEGPPVADNDLLATATPYPVLIKAFQQVTKSMLEEDKDLLAGLDGAGFKLDDGGEDRTGFQMMYLRHGGGYYFNVGASDMIIDGRIKLAHYDDMETFVPEGIKMKDGSVAEADLLVTATGYKNLQDTVRMFMGDEIADRAGPVWGYGEGQELRNMWQRTPQPGLWFTAGSLAQCRIYSKFLALQIKACEAGLLDRKRDQD